MFIKGKFTTLNEYTNSNRNNKFGGASIMKNNKAVAYYQMLNKPKIKTPCKLRFTWYMKKAKNGKYHDPDNTAFCKKYILDAMVKAKIIPDDTFKHIKGFIDEFVLSDENGVKIERVEE